MKHASSRDVFAYWSDRRGARPAPERAEIDPGAIRQSLGDVFMLSVDFVNEYRFRLAGTRVCALFGRELKNEAFASLWADASRASLRDLLAIASDEHVATVAGIRAVNGEGARTDLELLLLPLEHHGHARIRTLGVLAPVNIPFWLGVRPIRQLELGTVRHLGTFDSRSGTAEFVAAAGSTLKHGFVVHDGGKGAPPRETAG